MISSSIGFHTAATLASTLPPSLELPGIARDMVGQLISSLETGCVNMLEADNISEVHDVLHTIMVDAIAKDWRISMIDLANCFNPQKISTIAFDYNLHGHLVLQQIGLARPFQIHQAVSIVRNLVRQVEKTEEKHLIVVTDISSLFFDPAIANEDPEFPLPQLGMMRQCVGILQSLAVQGHMVVITNRSERKQTVGTNEKPPQIKPVSLKYSSKLHIKIENSDDARRKVKLLTHPYLPATSTKIRDLKTLIESRKPKKQMSLDEFF